MSLFYVLLIWKVFCLLCKIKNQLLQKLCVVLCTWLWRSEIWGSQCVHYTWNECVVLKTKATVLRQSYVIPALGKARCMNSMATMLLPANLREEIQVTKVWMHGDEPFQVCELYLDKNAQSLNPPFFTRPAVPRFSSICCVTSTLIWAPRSTKAQQDELRTGCWP